MSRPWQATCALCAGALALAAAAGPAAAVEPRSAAPAVDPGRWSRPVDLTDGSYRVVRPIVVMSADGQRITAMWRRDDPVALESVSSTDGGRTWRRPVLVTAQSVRATSYHLVGARDGSRLVATYLRGSKLYVVRSTTGGRTWLDPKRLASGLERRSDGAGGDLSVSATAKRAVVTFTKSGVLMARASSDAGAHWTRPRWVSQLGRGGGRGQVVMSRSGKHAIAVWTTGNSANRVAMYAAVSRDGGTSWSRRRTLVDADEVLIQNNQGPLLVGSGDGRRATAVWALERIGPFDSVVQAVSTRNRGKSWRKVQRLAIGAGPGLVASRDGSRVTVAFGVTGWKYRSRTSIDGGATWRPAVPTNVKTEPYFGPALAAAANGTPTLAGTDPLRVVQGTHSGLVWSAPVELQPTGYTRPSVAVAADGSRRVVVWYADDHPWVTIGR